jgi:membrane associated rhomboid family serine protease
VLQILCIGIALVSAYQGVLILVRMGPTQRLYAYLLLGDAAAALAGGIPLADDPSPRQEILGAVSIFGFVLLTLLPPLLQSLGRWAMAHEHLRLAVALAGLREHLQPGFGGRQERDMIEIVRAVEAGGADAIVAEIRARRAEESDPAIRRALDDRIVLTLLYAGRWREAIEIFETAAVPTTLQLLVEVMRAYGEEGDLGRAAEMLARLEELPAAQEPALQELYARGRMLLLAFAGRPEAVTALLSPRGALRGLSRPMRAYWIGTARLFSGDREGARASLREAEAGSEGRIGRLAGVRLAQVDDASFVTPRAMPVLASLLVDRVAGASQAPAPSVRLERVGAGMIPVTAALIAANVAVHLIVSLLLGPSEDSAVLVRAGANFRPAVAAGEWWRISSSTFLHVGVLHLGVNMLALWNLGRLVEQLYGSVRYLVLYLLAGLCGGLASHLFAASAFSISAGASGAVFGVLGAAIVDLWIGPRRKWGNRFRRAVLGNLVFLAAANLLLLGAFPMIDQGAHVGGFVAGGVAGMALGRLRWQPVAWALAAVLGVGTVAAGALAATTPLVETLDRLGAAPGVVDSLIQASRSVDQAVDERLLEREVANIKDVKDIQRIPAPPREGWHAVAFRYREDDELIVRLVYWRPRDAQAEVVRFSFPEQRQKVLAPVIDRMLRRLGS